MQYKIPKDEYIHGGTQKDFYGADDVIECPCMVCQSTSCTKLYSERGCLGIVKCNDCGFIYTSPRANDAERNYFGDAEIYFNEARLIFKGKKKHHRDKNYKYEIQLIKKHKSNGKLLDIGSSEGFFLSKARSYGYDVYGVEPSPSASKIAIEQFDLNIKNSYFLKGLFPSKHFDIITMIDVFEHVTNPIELLQTANEVLKDDGILCIKVPNGDYNILKLQLARLLRKENQHSIFNSYEHVGHYTPNTMKKILEKTGFKIEELVIPLPIHPPVWANLVGHYYQYPSPFILDWKRILLRNLFWQAGKIEKVLGLKIRFAPDLMFIIKKFSAKT
jgi:2-polyprenyl-3-methyl-5-hydroxy-6-metoxy-1,4-benzoquinol methylase